VLYEAVEGLLGRKIDRVVCDVATMIDDSEELLAHRVIVPPTVGLMNTVG
jgi:hypothetical protein